MCVCYDGFLGKSIFCLLKGNYSMDGPASEADFRRDREQLLSLYVRMGDYYQAFQHVMDEIHFKAAETLESAPEP